MPNTSTPEVRPDAPEQPAAEVTNPGPADWLDTPDYEYSILMTDRGSGVQDVDLNRSEYEELKCFLALTRLHFRSGLQVTDPALKEYVDYAVHIAERSSDLIGKCAAALAGESAEPSGPQPAVITEKPKEPKRPEWLDYTPEEPEYGLDMWDHNGSIQRVEGMSRDEFITLKDVLAGLRIQDLNRTAKDARFNIGITEEQGDELHRFEALIEKIQDIVEQHGHLLSEKEN